MIFTLLMILIFRDLPCVPNFLLKLKIILYHLKLLSKAEGSYLPLQINS